MAGHDTIETQRFREIGVLMQQNARDLVISLRPLLLADGFFEEHVNQMIDRALVEIGLPSHSTGLRLFSKWNCAFARKR